MCGVLMVYAKHGARVDRHRFQSALDLLDHRGPDYRTAATEMGGSLMMAQSVLSICGLPQAAPDRYATSRSGRYQVAYNGEIYNFRDLHRRFGDQAPLRTGSDTEVLVNLFDALAPADISRELEGMYAFVVFDRETRQVHVARDAVGEKPLFWLEDSRQLVIASEVRALLHYVGGRPVDAEALRGYLLTRHFMPGVRTEFQGVSKVRPGSFVTFDLPAGGCRIRRESGLDSLVSAEAEVELSQLPLESIVDRIDEEFTAVVAQMLPDCRYATIMSGGIDSTLVSWYLTHSRKAPDLLLCLDFSGLDPASRAQSRFEHHLGAPVELHRASLDEYTEELSSFYPHYCGLMPTHSLVSMGMLTRRVAALGIRVLFGGDGADELFGGYAAYETIQATDLRGSETSPSPYSGLAALPTSLAGIPDWDAVHAEREDAARNEWQQAVSLYAHVDDACDRHFQAMLYLDSGAQLESVGLTSSDRMAMLNSVESRSPFVHRRLLRLALNLPRAAKVAATAEPAFRTKFALKRLFARKYGEDLVYAKQGFPGFPNEAGRRLCGGDFRRVAEVLALPAGTIDQLLADRAGEWKLLNLELFLRSTGQ